MSLTGRIAISNNYLAATIQNKVFLFKLNGDTWEQIAFDSIPYRNLDVRISDELMVMGNPQATINSKSYQGKVLVYHIAPKPAL